MTRPAVPVLNRIERYLSPEPNSGCVLWLGPLHHTGYPHLHVHRGPMISVRRFVYEKEVGPIPVEMQMNPTCGLKMCVNTAHMEPITIAERNRRGDTPIGRNARRETCVHGHVLDEANTYFRPDTAYRACRICSVRRAAEYRLKHGNRRKSK